MRALLVVIAVLTGSGVFAVGLPPEFEMTDAGVGPITRQTPFNRDVIQSLLPAWDVRKDYTWVEGIPFVEIHVQRDGNRVLRLAPDSTGRIVEVTSDSTLVATGDGIRVGERFGNVYGPQLPNECEPGIEEHEGMLLCFAPGSRRVSLLFRGGFAITDGQIPPPERMSDWRVVQLWWQAFLEE